MARKASLVDWIEYETLGGIVGIDALYALDEEPIEDEDGSIAFARYLEDRDWMEAAAFEAWEISRGCAADPQSGY